MKIINLQSENFKRIKAIDITPKDNMVVISGENGAGKSSVLDSIFAALCGKNKELIKPIRDGETQATIRVELDKYIVTRTFKQGSTKLEVLSRPDGEIMTSPQTLLDQVVGSLAFDPLEFANMESKKQRELLLKISGLSFEDIVKERKSNYDHRHEVGVLIADMAQPNFEEIGKARAKVEEGKVNVEKLLDDIQSINNIWVKFEATQERAKVRLTRIQEIEKQISELKIEREALQVEYDNLTDPVHYPSTTKAQIAILEEKLQSSAAHNQTISDAQRLLEANDKLTTLRSEYDSYTAKIERLDEEKQRKLESAKMPIEGLSVDDETVIFNKIPFQQLSGAEKLKVSMAIAMAMNPQLRVIRILDGSLLDEKNMAVIKEMAGDKDFQIWIERVDSSGKVGIFIEDGEVVADNM